MARIPGVPEGYVPDAPRIPPGAIEGQGFQQATGEVATAATRLAVLRQAQQAQREYDQAMTGFTSSLSTKLQEIDQSTEADGLVSGLEVDLGGQLEDFAGTFTVSGEAQRMFRSRATHMLETARAQVLGVELQRQQARSEAELDLAVSHASRLLIHGGPLQKDSVMEMVEQAVIGREATLRLTPEQSQALQHRLQKEPLNALLQSMSAKGQFREILALGEQGFWDQLDGAQAGMLYNARSLAQAENTDFVWREIWKNPAAVSDDQIKALDATEGQKNNLLSFRESRGLYLQNLAEAADAREQRRLANLEKERLKAQGAREDQLGHALAIARDVPDAVARGEMVADWRRRADQDLAEGKISLPGHTRLVLTSQALQSDVAQQMEATRKAEQQQRTMQFENEMFYDPTRYTPDELMGMMAGGVIEEQAGRNALDNYDAHIQARQTWKMNLAEGNAVLAGQVDFSGTNTKQQEGVDQAYLANAVAGTPLKNAPMIEGFAESVAYGRKPTKEPIPDDLIQRVAASGDQRGFAQAMLQAQPFLHRGAVPRPALKGAVAGLASPDPHIASASARFILAAHATDPSKLNEVAGGTSALTDARLLDGAIASIALGPNESADAALARVVADYRTRRDAILPERIEQVKQEAKAFMGLPTTATDEDLNRTFIGELGPSLEGADTPNHFAHITLPESVLRSPVVQEMGWSTWGDMVEGMDWTVAGAVNGFREVMLQNFQAQQLMAGKPEDAFAAALALTFREVAPSKMGLVWSAEGAYMDPEAPPRFMRMAPEVVYGAPPKVVEYTLNRVAQSWLIRHGYAPQIQIPEDVTEAAIGRAVRRQLGELDPEDPGLNVVPGAGPSESGALVSIARTIPRAISWVVSKGVEYTLGLPAKAVDLAVVETIDALGFSRPVVRETALRSLLGEDVSKDMAAMDWRDKTRTRIARALIQHGARTEDEMLAGPGERLSPETPEDRQVIYAKLQEAQRRGDMDAQLKILRSSGFSPVARGLLIGATAQFQFEAIPGATPEHPQYLVSFHNGERWDQLRDADGNAVVVDLHDEVVQPDGSVRLEITEQPLRLYQDAATAREEGAGRFRNALNVALAERENLTPQQRTAVIDQAETWARPWIKNMGALAEPLSDPEFVKKLLAGQVEVDQVMSSLIARDPNLDQVRVEAALRGYLAVVRNIARDQIGVQQLPETQPQPVR